jgi:hypothetical protein
VSAVALCSHPFCHPKRSRRGVLHLTGEFNANDVSRNSPAATSECTAVATYRFARGVVTAVRLASILVLPLQISWQLIGLISLPSILHSISWLVVC